MQLSQPQSAQQPTATDWPPCPTPVNVSVLSRYLATHPDRQFTHFILQGLLYGFRMGFGMPPSGLRSTSRNHPSSLANEQVVSSYIAEEVTLGRMVGPITPRLHHHLHVSPIGLVPKGRDSGRWQMIVDLSSPGGHSTNDGISSDLCSLRYSSVDDALEYIWAFGRHTQLSKIDLKNTYRILPVHPDDRYLLAVRWHEDVYVDQALPFGLRSAPKLFTAFADALGWELCEAGLLHHIHYLDDFLFFTTPGAQQDPLPPALRILEQLGVPVAMHKIEGPSSVLSFLGILIDTGRCKLRLPLAKLEHMQVLLDVWSSRRSGPKHEFESLVGHLSHAATVVRQGRTFVRHAFTIPGDPSPPPCTLGCNSTG